MRPRAARWAGLPWGPFRSLRSLVWQARTARLEGRRDRAAELLNIVARKRQEALGTGDYQP